MRLRVKYIAYDTGGRPTITLSRDNAEEMGVNAGDRIKIKFNSEEHTGIVNIVAESVSKGIIGITAPLLKTMKAEEGSVVEIKLSGIPESLEHIRGKLKGKKLSSQDIYEIVDDVTKGNLSETEIASFVTTLHDQGGPTVEETYNLTMAMIRSGKSLKIDKDVVVDKHSIGGVPGDKTTLLVVPIITAAGLTIPKTSSRAITSAAGTADRAETFMPVSLSLEDMNHVIEKTNGCIVWGGALDLAPADDIFIRAEYPLSVDPMLLPSIMSKKKSVGSKYLVIDIPTGNGTKMKSIEESDALAKEFIELGKRIGIKTECVLTHGDQPLGHAVGSGPEAREALEILMRKKNVPDVVDKVSHVAGTLMEMAGIRNGRETAIEIIKSGKAEKKLREIIYAQGGDSEVRPEDIEIGEYGFDVTAEKSGTVLRIDNHPLVAAARAAGSPKNKKSGAIVHKKIGDVVMKGDLLYSIYSDKSSKLKIAEKIISEDDVYGIADRKEMLIHRLRETKKKQPPFILER